MAVVGSGMVEGSSGSTTGAFGFCCSSEESGLAATFAGAAPPPCWATVSATQRSTKPTTHPAHRSRPDMRTASPSTTRSQPEKSMNCSIFCQLSPNRAVRGRQIVQRRRLTSACEPRFTPGTATDRACPAFPIARAGYSIAGPIRSPWSASRGPHRSARRAPALARP